MTRETELRRLLAAQERMIEKSKACNDPQDVIDFETEHLGHIAKMLEEHLQRKFALDQQKSLKNL